MAKKPDKIAQVQMKNSTKKDKTSTKILLQELIQFQFEKFNQENFKFNFSKFNFVLAK